MTKYNLVPNKFYFYFYFMKPNKIVKRQISLFAHGQAHLNSQCSPFIMNKKTNKNQKLEDLKMSMHLKIG